MLANDDGDLFNANDIEEVRLYSEPSEEAYDTKTMTTGVRVVKALYILSLLKCRKPKEKRKAPTADPQEPKRKDVKAQVVREEHRLITGGHVSVVDAKADNHDDLRHADGFQIQDERGAEDGLCQTSGWRRQSFWSSIHQGLRSRTIGAV
jgi:hypothetical protein